MDSGRPHPVFDNPSRYQAGVAAFAPTVLAQVIAFHLVLTLGAFGLAWLVPEAVGQHGGRWIPVLVPLVLQVPLLYVCGRLLSARRVRGFDVAHVVLSLNNFVWLGLLAWEGPTFVSAILISLFAMWAYHDAWMEGDRGLRRVYLAAAPAADLALVVIDLTGGRGLLWAWTHERAFALTFLTLQVVLTALVQWMIARVAAEVTERDARAREQAALERQLAVLRRERETVQATASLLGTGLVASKVSHDLASPTSVLRLDLEALTRLAPHVAADARPEFDEVVADLGEAARQISELTAGVARAVRERESLASMTAHDLFGLALAAMRTTLRSHCAPESKVNVEGGELVCWVCPGHVSTLGNLLTNCALHSKGRDIDIVARRTNEHFLRVSIRDRGVDGEERVAALLRLNRLLALGSEATQESRGAGYRGFGVALILAKLYLIRYNGALAVRAAPEGPGLIFELVFPAVDPTSIAVDRNTPESALPPEHTTP